MYRLQLDVFLCVHRSQIVLYLGSVCDLAADFACGGRPLQTRQLR